MCLSGGIPVAYIKYFKIFCWGLNSWQEFLSKKTASKRTIRHKLPSLSYAKILYVCHTFYIRINAFSIFPVLSAEPYLQ